MDVTGGAGGGICPAAFLPLLLLLKRPARWRDLALVHLGTDVRARLAGMLDSPPQRCDRNNVQTVGSAGRSRKLPGGGISGQQGKKGAAEERQKNWVLVQVSEHLAVPRWSQSSSCLQTFAVSPPPVIWATLYSPRRSQPRSHIL
ncbi:PREDICTED: uncharacterized protein LOC108516446 isoform X3 [Rhinopithecus bieti]|uniref:uncharacterized protein LOC108516446 isoform X3 n=1 Tax=Rhinopithecus bieti TaxID=61621 RepID=UPI00083C3A24|nr:PREDICTED: uncharacterized protein LOC108516446 isoform X3 [Rhinopithecus bieti]